MDANPEPIQVTQLLEDSLAYLREKGWIQGWEMDPTGRACAVGALKTAVNHAVLSWWSPLMYEPFVLANRFLAEIAKEQFPDRQFNTRVLAPSIVDFNDHPKTTFEDLEKVWEKAIVRSQEVI